MKAESVCPIRQTQERVLRYVFIFESGKSLLGVHHIYCDL